MKHSDHQAALATLVPANKALAFVCHPVSTQHLHEALDISIERAKELDKLMSANEVNFSSNGGIWSNDLLTIASHVAQTPQELVWLTYQIAAKGRGKDGTDASGNRCRSLSDLLEALRNS